VIHRGARATELAQCYLEQTCQSTPDGDGRYPVVLIHYQGNTSAEYKNLRHELVREVCSGLLDSGAVPVILDWDRRSPLPDEKRIFNPRAGMGLWHGYGTGDAEVLAALIEMSRLMIGVDSGPLHVAAATSTPSIGVWTRHHPLHYIAPADNVTHLVPRNHPSLLRGNRRLGEAYFQKHDRADPQRRLT
jgi:ADP-heptose:LPS heptosyltransferase